MRREIVNGSHLNNLPVVHVKYIPRNIHTVAVQVTPETIGAMAIEFGAEIERATGSNATWIRTALERDAHLNKDGRVSKLEVVLGYGDWLVDIDGEVRVFPDSVMWTTFSQAQDPAHEMVSSEGIMSKEEFRSNGYMDVPSTKFMDLPAELQAPKALPDLPA